MRRKSPGLIGFTLPGYVRSLGVKKLRSKRVERSQKKKICAKNSPQHPPEEGFRHCHASFVAFIISSMFVPELIHSGCIFFASFRVPLGGITVPTRSTPKIIACPKNQTDLHTNRVSCKESTIKAEPAYDNTSALDIILISTQGGKLRSLGDQPCS